MAALDYTFERREQLFRAEEREEGRAEGIRLFIIDKLEDNVSKDKIIEKLVRLYEMSEAEANAFYEEVLTNWNK